MAELDTGRRKFIKEIVAASLSVASFNIANAAEEKPEAQKNTIIGKGDLKQVHTEIKDFISEQLLEAKKQGKIPKIIFADTHSGDVNCQLIALVALQSAIKEFGTKELHLEADQETLDFITDDLDYAFNHLGSHGAYAWYLDNFSDSNLEFQIGDPNLTKHNLETKNAIEILTTRYTKNEISKLEWLNTIERIACSKEREKAMSNTLLSNSQSFSIYGAVHVPELLRTIRDSAEHQHVYPIVIDGTNLNEEERTNRMKILDRLTLEDTRSGHKYHHKNIRRFTLPGTARQEQNIGLMMDIPDIIRK